MEFDYQKLNGKIVEKFGTQYNFAKAMGMSEHSLSKKLNSKVSWRTVEIAKAMKLLDIHQSLVGDYFFKEKVQNNLNINK